MTDQAQAGTWQWWREHEAYLLNEIKGLEAALTAAAGREEALMQLLRDLVDENDCRFDHHGGCQEHGYLFLHDGQVCPHAEAKQRLAEYDAREGPR